VSHIYTSCVLLILPNMTKNATDMIGILSQKTFDTATDALRRN